MEYQSGTNFHKWVLAPNPYFNILPPGDRHWSLGMLYAFLMTVGLASPAHAEEPAGTTATEVAVDEEEYASAHLNARTAAAADARSEVNAWRLHKLQTQVDEVAIALSNECAAPGTEGYDPECQLGVMEIISGLQSALEAAKVEDELQGQRLVAIESMLPQIEANKLRIAANKRVINLLKAEISTLEATVKSVEGNVAVVKSDLERRNGYVYVGASFSIDARPELKGVYSGVLPLACLSFGVGNENSFVGGIVTIDGCGSVYGDFAGQIAAMVYKDGRYLKYGGGFGLAGAYMGFNQAFEIEGRAAGVRMLGYLALDIEQAVSYLGSVNAGSDRLYLVVRPFLEAGYTASARENGRYFPYGGATFSLVWQLSEKASSALKHYPAHAP